MGLFQLGFDCHIGSVKWLGFFFNFYYQFWLGFFYNFYNHKKPVESISMNKQEAVDFTTNGL